MIKFINSNYKCLKIKDLNKFSLFLDKEVPNLKLIFEFSKINNLYFESNLNLSLFRAVE